MAELYETVTLLQRACRYPMHDACLCIFICICLERFLKGLCLDFCQLLHCLGYRL